MSSFLNHTKYQPWLTRFSLLTLGLGLVGFGWWLSLSSLLAATGVNQQLNYQGKLTNSSGVQVTDGSWNFRFKLYNASSGGDLIWTERWNSTSTRVTTV